jgi:hypothetical protein
MTTREALDKVLAELPELRLREILDFARYLRWLKHRDQQERGDWDRFGLAGLTEAYGPDEPEYTEADARSQQAP